MISDGNSSLRSRDFVRVGDERTSPTSYARTFECAGLMIRFKCTFNCLCHQKYSVSILLSREIAVPPFRYV